MAEAEPVDAYAKTDGEAQSILPMEQPPSVSVSDELYKEVLLSMRYQLKDDKHFSSNMHLLATILKNIINEPTNKKF